MCLHTNQNEPTIIQDNIICYVLRDESDIFIEKLLNIVISPFYKKKWIIGKLYKDKLFQMKKNVLNEIDFGFHSFQKLNDCKIYNSNFFHCKIFECIIPKNSLIWVGTNGWNQLNYCSNQLKLVKEIKNV